MWAYLYRLTSAHVWNTFVWWSLPWVDVSSFKSCPEENTGPFADKHTPTHIIKHTHIHSSITNDEHTPDMIITLSSSLSTSVRMFSLRDSSMDRDRAFLFLGLFKTILLEEDRTLLSVYNSFTLKHSFFAKSRRSFYLCCNKKEHNIRDGKWHISEKMSNTALWLVIY